MNAKEAKELSCKNDAVTNSTELIKIISKIREACEAGLYHIWVNYSINEQTSKRLEEMGYKVYHSRNYELRSITKIEWIN